MALLASAGRSELSVYQHPNVNLLCSGSELVDVSETPACGQVRNSNGSLLTALLSECGAEARYCGAVTDNSEQIAIGVRRGSTGG